MLAQTFHNLVRRRRKDTDLGLRSSKDHVEEGNAVEGGEEVVHLVVDVPH